MLRNLMLALAVLLIATPAMAGEATVSWTAPTQYEDGSSLPTNQIQSYKVYYGQTSGGPYGFSITVGGGLTTATITDLTAGTWYFVATTVATNGLESALSNQVAKTVVSTSKPRAPVLR